MGNLFIEFPWPKRTDKQKRRDRIIAVVVFISIPLIAGLCCAVLDPIVRPPHECPCECPVVP